MLEERNRQTNVYFTVGKRLCTLPAECITHLDALPPFVRFRVLPKTVLGLTNVGGTIMPLIDLHLVLDEHDARSLGDGELVVVALEAGRLALKVDKILRVSAPRSGSEQTSDATDLTGELTRLLGDLSIARRLMRPAPPQEPPAFAAHAVPPALQPPPRTRPAIGVETSKGVVYLSYDCIEMLSDTPTIVKVPDSNPIIVGVTIHQSRAIPVLSLDALLGDPPSSGPTDSLVIAKVQQGTIAIAVRRIMQLDFDRTAPLDLDGLVRPLLTGYLDSENPAPVLSAPEPSKRYLLIEIDGQCCGFDLAEVDRVETDNSVVTVPWGTMRVNGLTMIGGEVVPMLDIATSLGLTANSGSAGACVVLRDDRAGRVAVPADRLRRIVAIPDAALLKVDAQTELEAISEFGGITIWHLSVSRLAERARWRQNAVRSA